MFRRILTGKYDEPHTPTPTQDELPCVLTSANNQIRLNPRRILLAKFMRKKFAQIRGIGGLVAFLCAPCIAIFSKFFAA